MADISSELAFRITQQGAEDVRAGLLGIDQASKQTAGSTQTLTKFVKEQRRENLQANFLFKESRQAIGAVGYAALSLASATGGASKEMQKINQTLVSGFSAFQASSFAMAAMGVATGGVATAISSVLALGVSYLNFTDDAGESAKVAAEKIERFRAAMLGRITGLSLSQAGRERASFLGRLGPESSELDALERKFERRGKAGETLSHAEILTLETKIKRQKELVESLKASVAAYDGYISSIKEADLAEQRKGEGFGTDRGHGLNPNEWEQWEKDFDRLMRKSEREIDKKLAKAFKRAGKDADDITDSFENQRMVVMQLSSSFGNLQSGMHGLGIETDSWLGKLISAAQTLASIYEIVAAIKAITSIFSLGAGGAVSAAGAVAPPLPGKSGIGGSGDLQKVLRSPAVRNEMATMITDLARKGKI